MSHVADQEAKPYDFWLRHSIMDLKLAVLAKRVFSTLANSVPSERSFSTIRFLQSKVVRWLHQEK